MANTEPDLLNGLSTAEAQAVLALGRNMRLGSGEKLFQFGDDADHLFLIERGRLRLSLPMRVRGSDQDVVVDTRAPGQTVGWSALIPPFRFTLTATAPLETEVIALSRDALSAHFAANPHVGHVVSLNLASIVGQRLQVFEAMWLREMERTVELLHA